MNEHEDDAYERLRQAKIDDGECMTCYERHEQNSIYCKQCNADRAAIDRQLVLHRAALLGLETQLQRLGKSNIVDFQELKTDLSRAVNYLRNYY